MSRRGNIVGSNKLTEKETMLKTSTGSNLSTKRVRESITGFLSNILFRSKLSLATKLLIPLLLMVMLFLIPLIFVFRVSFWEVRGMELVPAATIKNYIYFLSEPIYQKAIWQSVNLAFFVSIVCLVLGYPLSLILTRVNLKFRTLVTFILISPLFISVIIRVFGWLVILENQGLINAFLLSIGVIDEPLKLVNNAIGVSIGLINVGLVFMVIPIVSVLTGIPKTLNEAALMLGANRLRAWWNITAPLSAPGVLAGFVLVFAITISAYEQPRFLGGAQYSVLPVQIYKQILGVLNWPLGAAMGFVLLAVSLIFSGIVYLLYRLVFPHIRQN